MHGPNSPPRVQDAIILGLMVVLAAVLRLLHLNARSLSLDDGFSVFLARANWSTFGHSIWHELNMVLYYFLLRMWLHLGQSEFVLRSLSVLIGSATVPAIYFVGRRLFGRPTALVASLLFAVHPFHLVLSQQLRSYPLLVLLITLSTLCFLRLLDDPSQAQAVLYALFTAMAFYSHFLAILAIAAQWLSLFWYYKEIPWKELLRSAVALATLLVPAAIYLRQAHASPVSWVPPASIRHALDVLYSLTFTKERCLYYVGMWAIALWCAIRRCRKEAWPYRFTMSWLMVPLAITAVLASVQSLWVPRFLAICIPASVLLASAGITQLTRWSRTAGGIVLLAILITSASAIRFYLKHPEFATDWRGAALYLLPRLQSGDQVAIQPYVRFTYDYYRDQSSWTGRRVVMADSLSAALAAPHPVNVWLMAPVLINPDDPASGPQAVRAQVQDFLSRHGTEYCAHPPQPQGASVQVWQFERCRRQ